MNGVELGNARVLLPGKLRWLRALGWMVALFVLCGATYALPAIYGLRLAVEASGGTFTIPRAAPESLRMTTTILAALAILGVYRAAVRWGEDRRVSELSLRELPLELTVGLAAGAAMMVVSIGLLWAGGWASVVPQPVTQVAGAIRGAIESGVMEEVLIRLIVLRLLWRAFGVWPALALSALLFGALHLGNPNATLFAAVCIAFEAGILLAAFYILTGRVWMSIGAHAGWNFTQGWVFGAAVSGGSGSFTGGPLATNPVPLISEILSGGAFGPEASLPALLVCTATGLSLIWLAWRRGQMREAMHA